MYTYGDEFTFNIDGTIEYFTTIGNVKIKDNEYIIAESEYGFKKAFLLDEDDEELLLVDEDDEDSILEAFERLSLENEDELSDYSELNDDYEYEARFLDNHHHDDEELDGFVEEEIHSENDEEYFSDDEDFDLDDIINELFDGE